MKLIKLTLPLLVALAYTPAYAKSSVTSFSPTLTNLNFNRLTVFADTYLGGGADTAAPATRITVYGSMLSGDVATLGAGTNLTGNFESVGAANLGADIVGGNQNTSISGYVKAGGVTTLGAGGIIKGYIISGDTATTGDHSQVGGNITSAGVLTVGANAQVSGNLSSGGNVVVSDGNLVSGTSISARGTITAPGYTGKQIHLNNSPVDTASLVEGIKLDVSKVAAQVKSAQSNLQTMTSNETLAAVIGSRTFTPGVYSTTGNFSPTAGSIFTLDAGGLDNQAFVFNIGSYLVFGGTTQIVMKNAGKNDTVVWNAASYAAVGAGDTVIGTILADTYISVGAGATVTGVDAFNCGGVYSQTSYVSTGDGASIGGSGCSASSISAVPEPETYAMMLAGLGLLGFAVSRKKQS